MRRRTIEEHHRALGAWRGLGHVWGRPVIDERHAFPGALGAWGGVGGHLGAPHVV